MTKTRLAYIQIALEASIPLTGFFAWGWNLYFILLFYMLDLLAGAMVMQLKSRQIVRFKGGTTKSEWLRKGAVGSALLLLVMASIHGMMKLYHPDISFANELYAFWTYEELGIQQGYLLAPLVFLMSFQQFRFEFMLPARYRTTELDQLWKPYRFALLLMLAACVLAICLNFILVVPEMVYVLAMVSASAAFSWWKLRQR